MKTRVFEIGFIDVSFITAEDLYQLADKLNWVMAQLQGAGASTLRFKAMNILDSTTNPDGTRVLFRVVVKGDEDDRCYPIPEKVPSPTPAQELRLEAARLSQKADNL